MGVHISDVADLLPAETSAVEVEDEAIDEIKKSFGLKGAARWFAGSSVKFIVTTTIVSLVPAETKIQKAKILVGSYVISGLIADKAKDYIEEDLTEKIEFCSSVLAYAKKLTAPDDSDDTNP